MVALQPTEPNRRTPWILSRRISASRSARSGRTPALAVAIVATLALCIGATTSIFSVVYAVLFRPFPFADPGGLLWVHETYRGHPGSFSAGNERRYPTLGTPVHASRHDADGPRKSLHRRRAGERDRVAGRVGVFPNSRRSSGAGACLSRGRGPAGAGQRRRSERSALADAVRRRRRNHRPGDSGGRAAEDGHRHHAAALRLRDRRRDALVAGSLHAGTPRAARRALSHGHRQTRPRGCLPGSAGGARRNREESPRAISQRQRRSRHRIPAAGRGACERLSAEALPRARRRRVRAAHCVREHRGAPAGTKRVART